jgi:hypothetical protein
VLTIDVKRGWKAGTRITFPKEGDQGPNRVPGNAIVRAGFQEREEKKKQKEKKRKKKKKR